MFLSLKFLIVNMPILTEMAPERASFYIDLYCTEEKKRSSHPVAAAP